MNLLTKTFFCILFVLIYLHSAGQVSISDRVQLDIISDTIRCRSQDEKVTIEYSVKNFSTDNLIFYNLNNGFLHSVTKNIARYCDPEKTGANVACIIFDQEGNLKSGSYPIWCDFGNPMTPQRADSLMTLAKKRTLNSAVIINANSNQSIKQDLDLTPWKIAKGVYEIQLIYFSGKKINWFADSRQQDVDQELYKAKVFQGCAVSPKRIIILE